MAQTHTDDSFELTKVEDVVVHEHEIVRRKSVEAALAACYRKIDRRLLVWYCIISLFMRINAHNISNVAIMNSARIQKQLGNLSSEQWALILSVFYFPYILCEPVATLFLKKVGPRKWMSRILLTWGVVSVCQAATENFWGLLACRLLLGIVEAGFFPSILYHLSFWYPVDRLPIRLALSAAFGLLSGTLSGLLAFAVSFMNEKGGLAGWQYLFILEGAPSFICGIATAAFLPNYPETASFLSEEEKKAVLAEIPETQPSAQDDAFSFKQCKLFLRDPTTWLFCLVWALHSIGARGVDVVLPTVIWQLGISGTAVAQLMSMPPYLFGSIGLITIALFIRKGKMNSWVAATCLILFCCVCYTLLICITNPIAKYVIIILATTSSIGVFPILWPERIRAAQGTTITGLAIGTTNAASHLQGIIGPQVYQKSFGPTYRVSFAISMGMLACAVPVITATWLVMIKRERIKSAGQSENNEVVETKEEGICV